MNPSGVVLRRLREVNGDTIKDAAKKIGKSAGWLSEIENERGKARISQNEFDRIVEVYGGNSHRKKFGSWIMNDAKLRASKVINFEGAIFKHLRIKKGYSLVEVSQQIKKSKSYLCNIETGRKPVSNAMKSTLLSLYGYKESSFKNFTTANKRGQSVPSRFKLAVLTQSLSEGEQYELYNLEFRSIKSEFPIENKNADTGGKINEKSNA